MVRNSSNSQAKRPRGRPKGSAPFEERDQAALSQFADQCVQFPGLKLAPFLKSLGYEDKDIRRAQIKWCASKTEHIDNAKERVCVADADQVLDVIARYIEASDFDDETTWEGRPQICINLSEDTNKSCFRSGGDSFAMALHVAGPETQEEAKFLRCLAEAHQAVGSKISTLKELTCTDLPQSQKLYAASMRLLEMSLQSCNHQHQSRPSGHGARSTAERPRDAKTFSRNDA